MMKAYPYSKLKTRPYRDKAFLNAVEFKIYSCGKDRREIRVEAYVGKYQIPGGSWYITMRQNGVYAVNGKNQLGDLAEGYIKREADDTIKTPRGNLWSKWLVSSEDMATMFPPRLVAGFLDFYALERSIGNMEI